MNTSTIRLYRIQNKQARSMTLLDMSSLDAITRQLPDGYYSTFRTYNSCTRVIGLSAHLHRLPNIDASVLRRNLLQLLEHFRPAEARVRLMKTKQGKIFIAIEPLKPLPPEIYEQGVHVETTSIQRHNPRVKSTTFISASEDKRKNIAQAGIFEALLVKNGKILEGMTSNFFYIIDGILYTTQRDILLGVTRTMVIRAARSIGIEARYRPLKLDQLPVVNEAFITSSSRGIVPVIQIDAMQVNRGKVGPITQRLIGTYAEYVSKKAELISG